MIDTLNNLRCRIVEKVKEFTLLCAGAIKRIFCLIVLRKSEKETVTMARLIFHSA